MPRSPAAARTRTNARTPRPSTRRGRAARNALSHGVRSLVPVIPGIESEEDWLAHVAAVFDDLKPVGHIETLCANHIALDFWRLKRLARYEILLVTHSDPNARPTADFGTAPVDSASPDSASAATTAAPGNAAGDQYDDPPDDEDAGDEDDDSDWEEIEASMAPPRPQPPPLLRPRHVRR